MAEYIPLEDIREALGDEGGASPSGQPAGGPADLSRSTASQPKALIGRMIKAAAMDLPSLILIGFLVMLAVMA